MTERASQLPAGRIHIESDAIDSHNESGVHTPMAEEDQGSFVRWQEITRNHFGTVCSLILALTTGLLAFHSTLLLDHKLSSGCAFVLAAVSMFFLVASVTFGLWCSVNRLRDFRLTMEIARRREKNRETDLEDLRQESTSLGRFTWRLFWIQVATFGLGASSGALAVVIQVWAK